MSGSLTREAVFYGLRTERPYDCRIEQIRYIFDTTNGDPFDSLIATLTRTLGDHMSSASLSSVDRADMSIDPVSTSLTDYPGEEWRDLQYWMAPTQFIYVFRIRNTVQVLTQTYILRDALRAERWSSISDERYGVDLPTWNLVNRLRPRDPEAADLLLSRQNMPDQEMVERVLLRLLQGRAAERRTDERKMLTQAITAIAEKLKVVGVRPEEARPSLRPLLALGVWFEESATDGGVWYGGYGGAGSRVSPSPDGTFLYRDTIRWNLSRLRRQPSQVSPALLLVIAEGYETWWSLSLGPADEELLTPSDHAKGAARARVEAIKWYERLIREFPYSREAERARRVIVQIRVGIDTGQREYFAPHA